MGPTFALPRGSRILVTGANGYIASHIVDVLLSQGYHVRGSIRESKPWLDRFYAEKFGDGVYESVVVPVIEAEDAFDAAMEGVAGVLHVATDISWNPDPQVVIPAVRQATVNILATASKHKSVKRVVLTSSSSAAIIPKPNVKGVTIDENSWNDEAVSAAWGKTTMDNDKAFIVYAASKTEGERAAWKWVAEHKPGFVFNAVLPNYCIGTILVPEKQHGSTMGFIRKLFDGDYSALSFPPEYYVDVGDCARLHVVALLDASIKDERIFAFAENFNWTDVITTLRKLRPNKTFKDPPANEGRDYTVVARKDRAEQLLKTFFNQDGWISFEKALEAGIADIE